MAPIWVLDDRHTRRIIGAKGPERMMTRMIIREQSVDDKRSKIFGDDAR